MKSTPGNERLRHDFSVMEAPLMKVLGVISTTAMLLLLGAAIPAYAQEEHHEEAAKPAAHEEAAKPAKQEQAKPAKQQEQANAKPEKQATQTKQASQEEHGKSGGQQQHAQRSAAEEQRQRSVPALRLSVRGSGRIPDDRFRANFGAEHVFVINEPVMVGGFSRFQYGGFWFGFENPWPDGWYYTDNVYVDYVDGGYYLCNPYYPGVHVCISVVI